MWRYRALLPVDGTTAPITLAEGWTPLLHAERLGNAVGCSRVFLKDDSRNPSGSFKDRGASLTITKCVERRIKAVGLPSKAGNLPAAFASYSVRAGIACYVVFVGSSPASDVARTAIRGAKAIQVDGSYSDANSVFEGLMRRNGWFDCRVPQNVFRVEGKKTVGYEIAEQLGWTVPDLVVTAAASGVNTIALWKAFFELQGLGWTKGLPKVVAVQPEGCAPLVRAFQARAEVEPWQHPQTFATGLEIPAPATGHQWTRALERTQGIADTVSDDEIRSAVKMLALTEGIHVQPASAAAIAWLSRARKTSQLSGDERVVCILTGGGNNSPEATEQLAEKPIRAEADVEIAAQYLLASNGK
jgi:threonine synthase